MTEALKKAAGDKPERKTLSPRTKDLPILDTPLPKLIGNARGTHAEHSVKKGGVLGARAGKVDEMPSATETPVVPLNPATGPEEKGKIPGSDLGKAWSQDAKPETKTWDVDELNPAKPEAKTDEKPEDARDGDEYDAAYDHADHGSAEHDGGQRDSAEQGHEQDEKEGEEKETPPTPGAWGSDVEFRKALEIIAFKTEQLEDDLKSGKKKAHGGAYKAVAGAEGGITDKIEVQRGTTKLTSTLTAEGLAGARAAAKTLLVADEDMLAAAVSAMAQAGAFGSAGASFDAKKGRAAISTAVKASGGIGAQVQGSAEAMADLNRLIPSLVAVFSFSAKVGVWGELSGTISGKYRALLATLNSSISGFAGAAVEAKGAAFANWLEGIGLAGQVGSKAGAEGKAATKLTIGLKDIGELEIEAGVMAFAGAEVKAKGKVAVSVTGVAVEGRAAAFAGARVSSYAKVGSSLRGREWIKVSGKVGVAVGAGAEIGGRFEFIKGKLVIDGDLAAVLKGGGDVGAGLELDLVAFAAGLGGLVADEWNKEKFQIDQKGLDYTREEIKDPERSKKTQQSAYETVLPGFQDYAVQVLDKVRRDKITTSRVLEHEELKKRIQDVAPRLDLRWVETDRGIERAAQDAFGDLLVTKDGRAQFGVDGGVVRFVDSVSPEKAKELAEQHKTLTRVHKVNDALRKDLLKYATVKKGTGEHGVKKDKVQAIIDKHWDKIVKAFPGPEAKYAVANAVRDTMGDYLGHRRGGEVRFRLGDDGKISEFGASEKALARHAKRQKEGFTDKVATDKINIAARVLTKGLTEYRAKLIADPKLAWDTAKVDGYLKDAKAKLPADAKTADAQSAFSAAILEAMDPIVTTAEVDDKLILSTFAMSLGKLEKERTAKASDAAGAARKAALAKFRKAVRGKRESLLKKRVAPDAFANEITEWSVSEVVKTHRALAEAAGKSAEDVALDANASDIAATANAVLAPLLEVKVVWGALAPVAGKLGDAAVFAEEQRKRAAKIKGGTDDDNARRALVADAVREDFTAYGEKLRSAVEAEAAGKTKLIGSRPTAVERTKLQKIIDTRTAKIAEDVRTTVGDAAVEDAVSRTFGIEGRDPKGAALLKKFSVKELKIGDDFAAVPLSEIAHATIRERGAIAQEQRVRTRLAADVKELLDTATKRRKALQATELQALVDKVAKPVLPHQSDDDLARLDMVVTTALGPVAGALFRVDKGVIAPATGPNLHRSEQAVEALATLRRELEQYSAERSQAQKPRRKAAVQSCLDAYRNNVDASVTFDAAHDELLAKVVLSALGGKGEVKVEAGEIVKLKLEAS